MKKITSTIIAAIMLIMALASIPVQAASWPSLSSGAYCEFTSPKKITVYKDSNCKTPGTSSPEKAYNAYISKNDVCKMYKITSSYIQVQYPTSSGNRVGYIKRADLLNVSSPSEQVTSNGSATTYVSAGGNSYGSVAKGDSVYACGTTSGYTAVIYTAKSGQRAYKYGWVKTSDYNSSIKGTTTTTTSSSKSLADIAAKEIGTKGYDKNGYYPGDFTTYGKWIGNDGVPWCASFVSWCVDKAGISTKVVPKTSNCNYMKNNSNSYHSWNSTSIKNIKRNDVIFFYNSSQGYHHVGIVSKVSGSKISVIEGNTGSTYGPDIVKDITYTVDSDSGKITSGYNGEYFKGYISVS